MMLLDNFVIGMTAILAASIRMYNQPLAWHFILNYYVECTAY